MEDLIELIQLEYYLKIEENEQLSDCFMKFSNPNINDAEKTLLDEVNLTDMGLLYSETDSLNIHWESEPTKNKEGSLNLLEIKWILQDQSEIQYLDGFDERLKHFRPVDQFVDEASCGILMNDLADNRMYYHDDGDSKLYSLDIDFKSYLELGLDAKFFLYWQRYIVELVHGTIGFQVLFKTGMKEVFPDFDLDAFTKKFQELRLNLD